MWKYDADVFIDKWWDVAFCWLRNGKDVLSVRVEVHRKFVRDNWGIEWSDEAVKAQFKARRMHCLEPASKASGRDQLQDFGVYVMVPVPR